MCSKRIGHSWHYLTIQNRGFTNKNPLIIPLVEGMLVSWYSHPNFMSVESFLKEKLKRPTEQTLGVVGVVLQGSISSYGAGRRWGWHMGGFPKWGIRDTTIMDGVYNGKFPWKFGWLGFFPYDSGNLQKCSQSCSLKISRGYTGGYAWSKREDVIGWSQRAPVVVFSGIDWSGLMEKLQTPLEKWW